MRFKTNKWQGNNPHDRTRKHTRRTSLVASWIKRTGHTRFSHNRRSRGLSYCFRFVYLTFCSLSGCQPLLEWLWRMQSQPRFSHNHISFFVLYTLLFVLCPATTPCWSCGVCRVNHALATIVSLFTSFLLYFLLCLVANSCWSGCGVCRVNHALATIIFLFRLVYLTISSLYCR